MINKNGVQIDRTISKDVNLDDFERVAGACYSQTVYGASLDHIIENDLTDLLSEHELQALKDDEVDYVYFVLDNW